MAKHNSKTAWIAVEDLELMREGNRRILNVTWIKQKAREFNPRFLGILVVGPQNRRGKYPIIDGQHRWMILHDELGWRHQRVLCEIDLNANEIKDKAAVFVGRNQRIAVKNIDRFRNEVLAGFARAVAIEAVVRQAGFRVADHSSDATIPGIKTLEKLYADLGEKGLEKILAIVTSAWGRIESAVHAHVLSGLGLVFSRYRDGLNIEELTRKLRDFGGGPAKIIAQARGSRELHGSSVPHNVAAIIVVAYNKGRRNEERRLVDWWTR